MGDPVDLVGLHGGEWFGRAAGDAIAGATVVVGASRHLAAVVLPPSAEIVEMPGDLDGLFERVRAWQGSASRVCLLASGDPGFFGLARLASARLGPAGIRVHPAPSSVSLAFARAGLHWDDAVVVSAHGRDPAAAVDAVLRYPKVAVLCSPATPPEALGHMVAAGPAARREVTVASRIGEQDETVWRGDIEGLAGGSFDPFSVVVAVASQPFTAPGLAWGRPESAFAHRNGMITKAEVRAVALGKLALPPAGVMWDVGAGSGSVSAECATLAPGLRLYAVERRREDLPMLRSNLAGTGVTVVEGAAPQALDALPDPDRVFVGGGGIGVLEAVLRRVRPGGTVVATYASPARAVEAGERLGNLVQVNISRGVPLGEEGGMRLAAENPVFVCWGPE